MGCLTNAPIVGGINLIKVLVVDDHPLICKGIRMLLQASKHIQVVDESHSGQDAIIKVERLEPHVVLLDLSMPNGLDGFYVCETIKNRYSHIKVIFLTMSDEENNIKQAIQCQADGYILKNGQTGVVTEAIEKVYSGLIYYRTSISEDQIKKWRQQKGAKAHILTNQEKRIVKLVALGFTNNEIGKQLFISKKTVENHKSKIKNKMSFSTKHEWMKYAINNHLLETTP